MPPRKVWTGNDQLARLLVPVGDLQPHPSNPRKGDVGALQISLKRFGQQRPVLCLPDGTLVAGHHVYYAAVAEGWTHIATVRSDLTGDEVKAYLAADNRTAELGAYDDAGLIALLTDLQASEQGLLGTGYGDDDVRALLQAQRKPPPGDPNAVAPEPPAEPKSQPGVVYELGAHRLMCGDSCNPEHVAALLAGAEPFLMLTDPPYGVSLDLEWRDRAGHNALGAAEPSYMQRTEGHTNTTISGDTKADWSDAFELVPSLKIAYVWHASTHAVEVGLGLQRLGFELNQMIIWTKPQFAMSRTHYHWQHEPCWYARKQGSPKWIGTRDQSTVWPAASPKMIMTSADEEAVDHPTQKPVELYTRPIKNHLKVGEAFYEPFGGSGSGIVAAEVTGRVCYAMEIDPRYADVIRERYATVTGREDLRP